MKYLSGFILLGYLTAAVTQIDLHAGVDAVANDWRAPKTWRQLRVRSATASTIFDQVSGNYLASKAHDKNRQTKWVAAERPSSQTPQWIDLTFSRDEEVSTIAVFGERIGNDGIVDAQIQVASGNGIWKTVATISNATSAAWLADFAPVKTTTVRLLVTRSSGPSSHTDVYEVEAYGPELPPIELQKIAVRRLAEARNIALNLSDESQSEIKSAWLSSLQETTRGLTQQIKPFDRRVKQWDELPLADQRKLADDIDSLADALSASQTMGRESNSLFRDRLQMLQKARNIFQSEDAPPEQRFDGQIEIANKRVLLRLAEKDQTWSAIWNGAANAAVFHVGFDVEVDGKHFSSTNVTTEVAEFADMTGQGKQITQRWGETVQLERRIRIYNAGAVTVAAEVRNNSRHALTLRSFHPAIITVGNNGGWLNGDVSHLPAAVYLVGASEWQCTPGRKVVGNNKDRQTYSNTQVLHLADTETRQGLTTAFLSAFTGRPDFNAEFRAQEGGVSFSARQNLLGRVLNAGEKLSFDPLYFCANDDAYAGLEQYADMAAHFASMPVRHGATALWCSWYAHRMTVDEELVLANASVAAKYFRPLGFEIMQLDHGWQVGDITGNWTPDPKSFPHGFKWLSEQLQSRYGLKLGVWIAPTDVAETSETFQQHPDWMLKDGQGKPLVNWRWYWKPNPNCFELDVSNPKAAHWMEDVFSKLSADGVSYYKIDFIAASAGEQFVQQDPSITRGWSVLQKAMESVRRGAGTNAWIRYCQPAPLLSAGLADSAYGGDDTLDAGLNGDIHVLRSNARSLAASSWLNDRLYHREVCDMSVRMQADIEEVRMRLALMTLANCSISFSDELRYLPESRLRMMQTCLPPGNPPMKPLDLYERTIPSIWSIHCKNDSDEWDIVGLFNFENTAETRTVDLGRLDFPADADIAAFEFWEQKFTLCRSNLTVTLPPQTSRIYSLRRVTNHPQIVGTDLHLLQGYHELRHTSWNSEQLRLSGDCQRAAGIEGRLFVYVPAGYTPHFEFPLNDKSARLTHINGNVWACELNFTAPQLSWSIPFDRK